MTDWCEFARKAKTYPAGWSPAYRWFTSEGQESGSVFSAACVQIQARKRNIESSGSRTLH